jgi:NifU-like protein
MAGRVLESRVRAADRQVRSAARRGHSARTAKHTKREPMREPVKRLICKCMGISDARLRHIIQEHGCKTVDDVTDVCNAAGTCGSCRMDVEGILGELAGLPPVVTDEDIHFADLELRLRSEATVENGLAPELSRQGYAIQFVDAYGLTVEVRVQGEADDGVLKWVEDRLREYIAPDLEVVIYRNRDDEPWSGAPGTGR